MFDIDSASVSQSDDITEAEFEALLDQLENKSPSSALSEVPTADNEQEKSNSDEITDDEFEKLLDQLHGTGKFDVDSALTLPTNASTINKVEEGATQDESEQPETNRVEPSSQKTAGTSSNDALQHASSGSQSPTSVNPAAAQNSGSTKLSNVSPAIKNPTMPQETTVRVDTKRLDDIMNMVGELVLVRNRLVRLGTQLEDEVLAKAVANLNVVTADLQTSVMKTRMQPIKKVFGRFPESFVI